MSKKNIVVAISLVALAVVGVFFSTVKDLFLGLLFCLIGVYGVCNYILEDLKEVGIK